MNEILAKISTETAQFVLKHTGFFVSSEEILNLVKKFVESIANGLK
jgi:hypothetical protein